MSVMMQSATPAAMKKQVMFDSVTIREYPYVAGDNPSVLDGPPLSLDWEHCDETVAKVEDKEEPAKLVEHSDKSSSTDDSTPEEGNENVRRLSPQEREDILEAWGISHREIRQATRQADKGRMNRRITQESVQLTPGQEKLNEWFEKVFRGVRNATYGKKSKERERQMLAAWRKEDSTKKDSNRMSAMTEETSMDDSVDAEL